MHMMQKLFKKKNPKTKPLRMSGVQKRFFVSYAVIVFAMMWCTTPVLAAGDPLAVVNNLSDFIFFLDPGDWLDLVRIWCGADRLVFKIA